MRKTKVKRKSEGIKESKCKRNRRKRKTGEKGENKKRISKNQL